MAKIIHAGGAQVSGSIGATTYTRNGYARRRSNPTNPNTTRQMAARARLAGLSDSWAGLTVDQREAWRSVVIGRVDRLGNPITVKGFQAFTAVNALRLAAGSSLMTAPVAPAPPSTPIALVAGVADQGGTLTVELNTAGIACLIYAGAPRGPGVGYDRNLKLLGKFTSAAMTKLCDVSAAWQAIYGALNTVPVGSQIFIEAKLFAEGWSQDLGGLTCVVAGS